MSYLYHQPVILDLPNDVPHDIANGDLAPGNSIKCGNRTDIPKKLRVHDYQFLGEDMRNGAAAGFIHGNVSACRKCGMDKFKAWKGPKITAVEKFLGISYGIEICTTW